MLGLSKENRSDGAFLAVCMHGQNYPHTYMSKFLSFLPRPQQQFNRLENSKGAIFFFRKGAIYVSTFSPINHD
jgi:hypothetical protein